MKLDNFYKDCLSSFDLANSRVIRSPSLIFLCGGETSNDSKSFKSCRDIFYHHIRRDGSPFTDKVILAEDVFQYFQQTVYKNLIEFEKDLAELSALIVLFSESPGSIAEFGSFSVLETMQDRLLVVMHKDDSNKDSFIWRGPALYLKELAKKNRKKDPVFVYFWPKRAEHQGLLSKEDFADTKDLEESIVDIMSRVPGTEAWNEKKLGHVMLLMLDLLQVVLIANRDEITEFLRFLGIDAERETVRRHLSLLFSLRLTIQNPYRNNVYYVSGSDKPWLSLKFKKDAKIRDVTRWQARFSEYYSGQDDQKSRAWRSYMRFLS